MHPRRPGSTSLISRACCATPWRPTSSSACAARMSRAIRRSPNATRRTTRILKRSVAKLGAAGAHVILGSDTGLEDHFFGYAEQKELELMVAAGMTPSQVIVAATSRAAEYLGLADRGLAGGGQARRSPGARRQPARRYPQHAADRQALSCGCRGRSCGSQGVAHQVCEELTAALKSSMVLDGCGTKEDTSWWED